MYKNSERKTLSFQDLELSIGSWLVGLKYINMHKFQKKDPLISLGLPS
jgi:hypothetical protein